MRSAVGQLHSSRAGESDGGGGSVSVDKDGGSGCGKVDLAGGGESVDRDGGNGFNTSNTVCSFLPEFAIPPM